MYDDDTLSNTGYEYSLGDIGITNKTTMSITYKDPRVTEFDDSYGHSYRLFSNAVENGFLRFDLHNLGTTKSGKTISAHVTVNKWKADRDRATFTYRKVGDIDGYSFVRSDEDTLENVTHVFKQHTTSWIDIDTGQPLKDTVKGIKDHGDINEYYFVETETKPTGDVVHKFKQIVTTFVTEEGKEVFPQENGKQKEKPHKDYSYKKTETDEHGNVKHIYHMFHTEFMDEDKNRVANREDGAQPHKDIPGYEYIRSIPEPDKDLVTHIYRQITTSWLDENGKELKPVDKGSQPHGEFTGYTYVKTETDTHGNIIHTFKKNGDVPTGVASTGFISLIASGLSVLGITILNKKKKEA